MMSGAPQLTADEVERGYNNRAAVPDHPRWFARYAQWSAAAFDRCRPSYQKRCVDNILKDFRYQTKELGKQADVRAAMISAGAMP